MGLDMYLEKRTYVKRWAHTPTEQQFSVKVKRGGQRYDAIKPERVSYVIEEVAYWRKANAIHRWFVKNVQNGVDDCRSYFVSREQLKELLSAVDAVLLEKSVASEILPTQSGFFFGGTDYDEDYRADLEDTKRQLTPLLKEVGEGDFYYSASW